MTRTNAREIAVHLAYELEFCPGGARELLDRELTEEHFDSMAPEEPLYARFPDQTQEQYIRTLVEGVSGRREELDAYISRYAVGWSFSRLPKVAVAVMRVAMYEVLYMPDVPDAAAINEAVEIAKDYESAEVVSYINGILGSFSRDRLREEPGANGE